MTRRLLLRPTILATLSAAVLALVGSTGATAQTYNVIYTFTGHGSSSQPIAGVTVDRHGNLFGASAWGGMDTPGDVYELQRAGSGFVYSQLFVANSGSKGNFPWDTPTIGPNGSLYVTMSGGGADGAGTVLNVQPPAHFCPTVSCAWVATDLYNFTRGSDGGNPEAGVIFDPHGNIYGAAPNGSGYGVVFEMTPSEGGWLYQVIYTFTGGPDGAYPIATLLLDSAGNLYGSTESGGLPGCGGFGCGTIFKLSPSGSGWTKTTLYSFHDGTDGSAPSGGLIADNAGNLYGATGGSDSNLGGTVFELTPSAGGWIFNVIYDLPGAGLGPTGNLVRDSAGNLYGSTWADGAYGQGNVFKLSPTNHGWTYASVHDFTGSPDGANASGGLAIDSDGVIYGTTYEGGSDRCLCGVVYEVTP